MVRNDFNPSGYRDWLYTKYSKTYAYNIFNYSRKFSHLLSGKLNDLELLSPHIRSHVIKSLIVLSKYLGIYEQFKQKLTNYGIKTYHQDSFASFLRILNNNNNGNSILKWIKDVSPILNESENVFLRFCLYSGLRKSESIISFNKIIELFKSGNLENYYDSNLNCLLHFKYPKEFIRRTKNCFISFIPLELINQICNCKPVSYSAIHKRLERKGVKIRINELRDYFGTYLLQHGILEAEINLLQGRIPPSIFIKHYWSPKLTELRDRVFEALRQLEQQLN